MKSFSFPKKGSGLKRPFLMVQITPYILVTDSFKKIIKKHNKTFVDIKKQGLEINFLHMAEKQK